MSAFRRMMITVALLGAGAGSATAQAAPAAKVAFVNVRAVLSGTPEYAKAESLFAKEIEGYRAELAKLQASLDSAGQDFEQASVLLSPSARTAKRKELEEKNRQLEARNQEIQQKAAARERELLDPIQSKVSVLIEAIRAEGGYAMIFDVSGQTGIVAADKSLDLTAQLAARLKAAQ
ncbi:MAG TPA: OmpH family outer membrane protein [Gemmatimonadales bacterium]|nr:OmpH family outer membrane protein [Gemmatimonadales bacterium]